MMRNIENILRYALFVVAFLVPYVADAQEDSVYHRRERRQHGVYVDFRVNSATLDPNYRNNRTVISRVDSIYNALKNDKTVTIEAVEFRGTASPEGNSPLNSRLSRARMLEVEKYVRQHISFENTTITYNDRYVDWDHLIELVEADQTLPMREEVLKIVKNSYPDVKDAMGQSVDGRVPELKKLDDGQVWRELLKRYFVKMRTGAVVMLTYTEIPIIIEREPEVCAEIVPDSCIYDGEPVVEEPVVEEPVVEEPVVEEPAPAAELVSPKTDFAIAVAPVLEALHSTVQKNPLMSVKTNLLAYSTLIPNLGVEVRLANHWSAEITALYSPYDLFANNRKTRLLAMKPEVRYWFGESMRKGHFVGVHVPIAGFNIQLENDFRYQDPNHALWGLGLNYGYALPLGKNQKWSLDFTIGFGYMDLRYDVYEGVHNGKFIRSEMKHYFGPTRIGINLSYLINKK